MAGPNTIPDLLTRNAALGALRTLRIPFRGPFVTPRGNRIFLIGVADCILTESEIISFYQKGRLTAESAPKLLRELENRQVAPRLGRNVDAPLERRRSRRIMLQLAVLIKAEIATRKIMCTNAFTVCVSAHGGVLECPFRLALQQRLTLINSQSRQEVTCTVVHVKPLLDGFSIAFEFSQPNPRFWPLLSFPLDWVPEQKT